MWLTTSPVSAQPDKRDFIFETVHEYDPVHWNRIAVYNPTGNIEVTPAGGRLVRVIERIVIPATDSSYAAMFLNDAVVTYEEKQSGASSEGNRVEVRAVVRKSPRERSLFGGVTRLHMRSRARVQFEVQVPPEIHLQAETTGGTIRATSVEASLELNTVSGAVSVVESTRGSISMNSNSGPIYVAKSRARMLVHTTAGDVTVSDCAGSLLWIEADMGTVQIDGMTGEIYLKTSSGSVETVGTVGELACVTRSGRCVFLGHTGPLNVESSSGSVEMVGFPSGNDVQITTISGDIGVQLGEAVPRRLDARSRRGTLVSTLSQDGLKSSTRQLSGDWEGGSGELYLETTEGQIRLSRGT